MRRKYSAVAILAPFLLTGTACAQSEELDRVAKAYRIQIVTASPSFPVRSTHGIIDGRGAEQKALDDYAPLFAAEFSLYPPDYVKRSQLRRIVLSSELSFAGQRRNAIPDYEHNTLYLDVSRGAYSKPYLRKVIHHEFFHIVDWRDDGSVYSDPQWASLNPSQFRYGRGGRNAQELATTSVLTDRFPGFLNHYSTTGVEEDKAEILANLIVDPGYVDARAGKDPVLMAKVERMRELLATFSPDMNDAFWAKVRTTKP